MKSIFDSAFPIRFKKTGIKRCEERFRLFDREFDLSNSGIVECHIDDHCAETVCDKAFFGENDAAAEPLAFPVRNTSAAAEILICHCAADAFVDKEQAFTAKLFDESLSEICRDLKICMQMSLPFK